MILLDKPYVSGFLAETIKNLKIPVIQTDTAVQLLNSNNQLFISQAEAVECLIKDTGTLLYTNSENAVRWIEDHLKGSKLAEKIHMFKNKARFRDLIQDMFPEYFYKEVSFSELAIQDIEKFRIPLVIKPAVGFFSIGVKTVHRKEEWNLSISDIKRDIDEFKNVYPDNVLNTDTFILEAYIEGSEYAVDAYFNSEGIPVILNIMKHLFSDEEDVSDRVYISSKEIIQNNQVSMYSFLEEIGKRADLRNFPLHAEVRLNKNGLIQPIEINPLRFGAWCTTADFAGIALKSNTYEHFWRQTKPDWDKVFRGKEDRIFSMIVLDNSTGVPANKIESFDHEKLKTTLSNILEYRETDYRKYKIFGFIFTETKKNNTDEIDRILHSDLREYIRET